MAGWRDRPLKKGPPHMAEGRWLGGLSLMYLSGRDRTGETRCKPRRETGDSNPGPPRLKGATGLEPVVRTDSGAAADYMAASPVGA